MNMPIATLIPPPRGMRFLHRFSDGLLHTSLMVAIVLVAGIALYKAITLSVEIWQLEPVVIEGQASTPPVIVYGQKR